MAENEAIPPEPSGSDRPAETNKGPGARGKLIGLAFVLMVVLVECAVAVLVFPSADDADQIAQAMLAEQDRRPKDVDLFEPIDETEGADEQSIDEVDLGEYDVSSYQPLSNTTIRISLHLFGAVLSSDAAEVLELMENRQQRMREQVLVTLRSAEITDLTDAGLGLIKRKILEKTNRTFGKPLIQQIVFSEFSFFEQ